jgi:hypothetical protein
MIFDVRDKGNSNTEHTVLFADIASSEDDDAYYVTYNQDGVAIEGVREMVFIREEDLDNCILALKKVQELIKHRG